VKYAGLVGILVTTKWSRSCGALAVENKIVAVRKQPQSKPSMMKNLSEFWLIATGQKAAIWRARMASLELSEGKEKIRSGDIA
jgi:hypothetical protein